MADVRADLAEALRDRLSPDQLDRLINEVLSMEKNAWAEFNCKDCGKRQRQLARIPDHKGVTQALTELLNQGFGRPTEQKTETEIVVNRQVFLIRDEDDAGQLDVSSE